MAKTSEEKGMEGSPPAEEPGKGGNGTSYTLQARLGLVSVLHLMGRVTDRIVSAYDSLVSLDDGETAKIYMGVGADFARDGKTDDALAALTKTLEMQPDNGDAWLQVGSVYLDRQEPVAAVEAFERAKTLGHDSFQLHYLLAEAYGDSGNHEGASKELGRAVELDPSSAESFFRLGVALDNLENFEEAVKAYQKAIDLSPRESAYYQSLGFTFERLERHEQAIACFKRAVELDRRRRK